MLNYLPDEVLGAHAGDVVTIGGKRFIVERKTSTAVAVRRWYWFDELFRQILEHIGSF